MKETIDIIYKWLELSGKTFNKSSEVNLGLTLIEEELTEFNEAIVTNNREEQLDAFSDLIWVILNTTYSLGLTQEELVNKLGKVNISNYTKFCDNEEDALQTVLLYQEGKHPDKMGQVINAHYIEKNGTFIILRDEDEKVLKSHNYIPVRDL